MLYLISLKLIISVFYMNIVKHIRPFNCVFHVLTNILFPPFKNPSIICVCVHTALYVNIWGLCLFSDNSMLNTVYSTLLPASYTFHSDSASFFTSVQPLIVLLERPVSRQTTQSFFCLKMSSFWYKTYWV